MLHKQTIEAETVKTRKQQENTKQGERTEGNVPTDASLHRNPKKNKETKKKT